MRDLHIRPCQSPAVDEEERFDRVACLEWLDVAVFANKRFDVGDIGTDHCPIRLLTDEIAWICAARRVFRDDRPEVVDRRRPRRRLDDDIAHAAPNDRDSLRLGIGQKDEARSLGRVLRDAVEQHGEIARRRFPIDHQTADLALHAQIDRRRRKPKRLVRNDRQRLDERIGEPDRAFATTARGDHDFDRRDVREVAAGWSPRELDLTPLRFQQRPVARKDEVAAILPPDVLATRLDQFQLEVLRRRIAADAERDLKVRRKVEIDLLPRDGVAAVSVKVEVEPVRVALARQVHLDAVSRVRGPLHNSRCASQCGERTLQNADCANKTARRTSHHPFTLPAMMPAM